jgi:hypothetical protein
MLKSSVLSKKVIFYSSLPSWASRDDMSSAGGKIAGASNLASAKKLSPEDRPIVAAKKNFDELLAEHLGSDSNQVKFVKFYSSPEKK